MQKNGKHVFLLSSINTSKSLFMSTVAGWIPVERGWIPYHGKKPLGPSLETSGIAMKDYL